MWRSVKSDLVARLLQDRSKHMADRSFAIGPCHMDGRETQMRLLEICIQLPGILKIRLICSLALPLVYGQAVIKKIDGFLVGHFIKGDN